MSEETPRRMLNLQDLRERGWTPALVRKFLGKEDAVKPNPFYRRAAPQRLYAPERVAAAETSADFAAARAKAMKRSERACEIAARKAEQLLDEIRQLQVRVTKLPMDQVRRQAIRHYHRRQADRGDFDGETPAGPMLERVTVNEAAGRRDPAPSDAYVREAAEGYILRSCRVGAGRRFSASRLPASRKRGTKVDRPGA